MTSTEKLQLKVEVVHLKEASGDMEGRAITAKEAEKMKVTKLKEVLE